MNSTMMAVRKMNRDKCGRDKIGSLQAPGSFSFNRDECGRDKIEFYRFALCFVDTQYMESGAMDDDIEACGIGGALEAADIGR